MDKQKRESGYYWVPRSMTCNGCKFCNFYKRGCRRNMPPGEVRPLVGYLNGDGYQALLRPADCDYHPDQPQNPGKSPAGT